MKTEFLVLIPKNDSFCNNEESLINLLKTDSSLSVKNKEIYIKKEANTDKTIFASKLTITHNIISPEDGRFFLVTIENTDSEVDVELFNQLVTKVKDILTSSNKMELNILWDSIGRYYAEKAYPLINETENLMRKLITMFLTINVGLNWHKESISSSLLQITERNTSKDQYLNPLYDLDFIDLSSILFELRHDIFDKLDKLLQKKDLKKEDIEEIRSLRKSTWDKYFAEKLAIKGEDLKKKWEMLYKLRCAIAHNRYILREDYEKIKGICSEINKVMSNALDKINVISINENEKETIKREYKQAISLSDLEAIGAFKSSGAINSINALRSTESAMRTMQDLGWPKLSDTMNSINALRSTESAMRTMQNLGWPKLSDTINSIKAPKGIESILNTSNFGLSDFRNTEEQDSTQSKLQKLTKKNNDEE